MLLPPVNAELNITDGSLLTIGKDNLKKTVVKDLNLLIKINGDTKIIDYQLSFQDDPGTGRITGEGHVLLPQDITESLDTLQSKADLKN